MSGRITRRQLVAGGAGAAVGAGAVLAAEGLAGDADPPGPEVGGSSRPAQAGTHQPGVNRPRTPQSHQLVTVLTWPDGVSATPEDVRRTLAALGEEILTATSTPTRDLLPDGPADLTVQVGLGPRVVRRFGADLPGAEVLPAFAGSEELPDELRRGDLVLLVAGSDTTALVPVTDHLVEHLPGATVNWQQQAQRPPGDGPRGRNPFGYLDGVAVPEDREGLERGVWIAAGAAEHGSIGVIRRFALDLGRFHALSPEEQDRVFGRRRIDGAPLSGGTVDDDVNLLAKSPSGDYLVPAHAHARAAHPSFTGSPLMMRRSYGFVSTDPETQRLSSGMLFVSYQNDLDVFVRTQRRLDETDALMTYVTCTAEVTFLVLPGFGPRRPLGASLTDA